MLQNVRDIILMWQYRTLTPYGKVQIVNALLSSTFAHKLLCLPSPPDNVFKKYKEMIVKFVWTGYANKVQYVKAIQEYEVGGLKLNDVELKDIALKSSWVQRLNIVNAQEESAFYIPLPIKMQLI